MRWVACRPRAAVIARSPAAITQLHHVVDLVREWRFRLAAAARTSAQAGWLPVLLETPALVHVHARFRLELRGHSP